MDFTVRLIVISAGDAASHNRVIYIYIHTHTYIIFLNAFDWKVTVPVV